jgi:hypothetical protein
LQSQAPGFGEISMNEEEFKLIIAKHNNSEFITISQSLTDEWMLTLTVKKSKKQYNGIFIKTLSPQELEKQVIAFFEQARKNESSTN